MPWPIAYAASVVLVSTNVRALPLIPLVLLLIVFAAGGVDQAAAALAARQWRVDPVPLAAVALVAVFANWPMLPATLMRAITETNLGVALRTDGRVDDAVDRYHRAIALQPDYAPATHNLAPRSTPRAALTTRDRRVSAGARPPPGTCPLAQFNLGERADRRRPAA